MMNILDALHREVSHAVRALIRSPGLTTSVIVTFGLGVGANAAVFTALDRVFFQAPPGVVDPGTIQRLYAHKYSKREPWYPTGKVTPLLAVRDLEDLRHATRGRARIEGDYLDLEAVHPGDRRALVSFVSPGYFDFLGVHPARGRFFASDENLLSGAPVPVAIISDAFWRTQFGSDPAIVGKTVRVDETTYTIIGVAPRDFEGLELRVVDLWVPLANLPGGLDGPPLLRLIARRDKAITAQAFDRLLTVQFRATHVGDAMVDDSSAIITAPLLAARGPADALFRIPGMPERSLSLLPRLAGAALLVLLIAIANVASLLLMRASRRRREIAVRVALGVSRRRLVAQLVIESTILALAGGAAALVVAALTGRTLRVELANGLRWTATVVDERLVLLVMAIAIVAGVAAGLAPALFALRTDVSSSLKASGGATRAGSTVRTALLVGQAALCMALLACAGVFLQSLRRAADVDRGFDPERSIQISVPAYYPNSDDEITRIAERLRSEPGIEAVGRSFSGLALKGLPSPAGRASGTPVDIGPRGPLLEFVEPDFLRAAGMRLVDGRMFAASDNGAPVALVNQALAGLLWPGQRAVGSCIRVREPHGSCRPVIGVVRDVRWDLSEPPSARVYLPIAQAWSKPSPALVPDFLVARMRGPASGADAARLRAIMTPMISPGADLSVRRVGDLLEPELRPWRLAATLFLILGLLGLTAATAGIYGLIAYDVAQRSRELGVRMALGATSANIVALVVRSGVRVVLVGIGVGTVVALIAGQVVASLLFATSPYDVIVLGLVALTLAATAAVASVIPAWRAVRLDPSVVLSSE